MTGNGIGYESSCGVSLRTDLVVEDSVVYPWELLWVQDVGGSIHVN